MGRAAGRMITYDDAIYMAANENFTAKKTIPSSKQIMTKEKLNEYLELDADPLAGYALTQAVPYDKIQPKEYIYFEPSATVAAAYGGGTYTLQVRSNTTWTVSGSDAWTTVSPTSGTGDAVLSITVDPNPNYTTRQDTMELLAADITGAYFYVQQAAKVDDVAPFINNFVKWFTDSNRVLCTWDTVTDEAGGSGLSKLQFYYRPTGGVWNVTDMALDATQQWTNNLNTPQQYEFKLKAQDNAGNSRFSNTVYHTIPQQISVSRATGEDGYVSYLGDDFEYVNITSNTSWTATHSYGADVTVTPSSGTGNYTNAKVTVNSSNYTGSTKTFFVYFRTPNGTQATYSVQQTSGSTGGGGGGTTTT